MNERPLVSIVIVSWNVRELLRACLASIERFCLFPHQVIVIDNASHDGSVEMIRSSFPSVQLISKNLNVGFARANNEARVAATAPWVCFLNPDTELIEDVFSPLFLFAQQHQQVGALGPEILNRDRSHQQSVRVFPKLVDQLTILFKLNWLLQGMPWMKRYYADAGVGLQQPIVVDQIMGAMMLLPSQVLTEVGWFDDGYPNWFEEVDLCQRIKRAGYSVWYAPISRIIHHGNASFGQVLTTKKHRWFLTGLRRYTRRYWPWWQAAIIDVVSVISYGLTIVQLAIKPR